MLGVLGCEISFLVHLATFWDNERMMQPTCRYGHGSLVEQSNSRGTGWAVMGIDSLSEKGNIGLVKGMFTVRLWKCLECGYLEMFDDGREG